MGRTLVLTSPFTHGDDVVFTQECLKGDHGPFASFYAGPIDGIYGEATAAAAKKAKYYLGYPLEQIDEQAGDTLRGYLQLAGSSFLPDDYQQRRGVRLNPQPVVEMRTRAIALARTQIGVKESPAGSNDQKYGAWYGANGVPWCAIFQTWCWDQVGSAAFQRGSRYAYVPYVVADARAHHNSLGVIFTPQAGDLVCYFWSGEQHPQESHIGLFVSGNASAWDAIEGNTSTADNSNGGEVMLRHRQHNEAAEVVFVRVYN